MSVCTVPACSCSSLCGCSSWMYISAVVSSLSAGWSELQLVAVGSGMSGSATTSSFILSTARVSNPACTPVQECLAPHGRPWLVGFFSPCAMGQFYEESSVLRDSSSYLAMSGPAQLRRGERRCWQALLASIYSALSPPQVNPWLGSGTRASEGRLLR